MPNLTGDYDVVIEVGVNVINGILGAVHENQDTNFPVQPHSMDLLIDDAPRGSADPVPAADRTGVRSRVEVQVSTPIVSLPVDTIALRTAAAPGPAPSSALVRPPIFDPGSLGGILIPPNPAGLSRVTATVRVRAWVRDPTDGRLPEFVDGELTVTSGLVRSEVVGVGSFLTLDRENGPEVSFQPSPGTDCTDEQRQAIAAMVRNLLRSDTEPQTFRVSVPPDVTHFDFELQPGAHRPSVMILLTLTDRDPGPGARDSVDPGLLPDGADFAVAVGRDFLAGLLRSKLFQGLQAEYGFSKLGLSVTIRPDRAGATFDLEPGRIVFKLTGDGDVSAIGISDHFTFTVRQAFTLRIGAGGLEPVAGGDPVVDVDDLFVGTGFVEGKARDAIREERDNGLAAAAGEIRRSLDLGGQIEKILSAIHPASAGVVLTGVEVRPEGVLVPGTIALSATGTVVVTHTFRDGFHDALNSWIPGGTIDRFVWESAGLVGGGSDRVDDHRFVTEPLGISIFSTVCLRVEGTRVTAGGRIVPAVNRACSRFSPVIGPVTGVSTERSRPLLPLVEPVDGRIAVVGRFDPWAPGRVPPGGHANLLMLFGSDGYEKEADALREALAADRTRSAAILPLVVVPNMPATPAEAPGDYFMVEDPDGGWAAALGVGRTPAWALIGPGGDVLWKGESALTAKKLVDAIGRYAQDGGEVATLPIQIAIRQGDPVPDVPLRLIEGAELSLGRLEGRRVTLAFWTLRSGPSIDQLEFLRGAVADKGSSEPLVIAVGDGESRERVAELVKERSFPFTVLADPDRLIGRAFGVWCWPATVRISADLRIEAVDFGSALRRGGS